MPETNNLRDVGIDHHETVAVTLDWTDPDLMRITRIRFVGDTYSGLFDLSYVLGTDRQGQQVRVRIRTYQVIGMNRILRTLVADAKADGVYLKGLCDGPIGDVLSVCW